MKKLKDNEISLLMDFTGIPVSIPLQALFTFFSSGDISTEAVVFCNWFPVMWQMTACFFAIRYIRKNPNDRRGGVIYLGISLISYIGCTLWGHFLTIMALHPWGVK